MMVQMQEVETIRNRVEEVASRLALHGRIGHGLEDESVQHTTRLATELLRDLPEQRCETLTDALALAVYLRGLFIEFADANDQRLEESDDEMFRSVAGIFRIMSLILERITQGLEDATGERAERFAWHSNPRQFVATSTDA